jgi:hypothetical protein
MSMIHLHSYAKAHTSKSRSILKGSIHDFIGVTILAVFRLSLRVPFGARLMKFITYWVTLGVERKVTNTETVLRNKLTKTFSRELVSEILFPFYVLRRHSYTQTASVIYWSESLATEPEVRVRFSALPDYLRSSGSGTRSTQPREYNWGATLKKK